MSWLLLALITALLSSLRDVFVSYRSAELSASQLALAQYLSATVLLGTYVSFHEYPPLTPLVIAAALFAGISVGLGTLLFFFALQKSDVSLMIPLRAITPVLILLLSVFFLNESIGWLGALAVCVVTLGLFVVNNPKFGPKLFSEFAQAEGTPYMILGAVIFSLCAISEKIGIINSDPIYFCFLECAVSCLTLLFVARIKKEQVRFSQTQVLTSVIPVGLLFTGMFAAQSMAYDVGPVSYITAIKRSGTILTVILGCLILKEGGFRRRFLGCLIVFIGAVILGLQK